MALTRRHLFGLVTGAAAYALAPEPVRRYFVIGLPERRVLSPPFALISPEAALRWERDLFEEVARRSALMWRLSVDTPVPPSLTGELTVVSMYGGVEHRVASLNAADWPLTRA